MLFSSYQYIFLFLPISFSVYFFLNHIRQSLLAKIWLVLASLFFYGFWDVRFLPLILLSIIVNFLVGSILRNSALESIKIKSNGDLKKIIFILGIAFNLFLLGYFKYTDFFLSNLNALGAHFKLPHMALPLAISFFTFQQIAYIVDSYKERTENYSFLNYLLFVTFFPQLFSGPITYHKDMIPQFASKWNKVINYRNISLGIFIFSIGLFKKVIISDVFAIWANQGFDHSLHLTILDAWFTSLSYTFQLYFDFSGYTDMAIGAALFFNIKLPINFNSPYKALNIQDFWRRWHITLSRFLRNYIYIPLGGNRKGEVITYANLLITFLIGGLWHGANWMFIIWGLLHGLALIIHRIWGKLKFSIPKPIAWLITFNFINITWVFFRSRDLDSAIKVLSGMVGLGGIYNDIPADIETWKLSWSGFFLEKFLPEIPIGLSENILVLIFVVVAFFIITQKNTTELTVSTSVKTRTAASILLFTVAMLSALSGANSVSLYSKF
ncbi:MBOAT family protein [Kosakonia sp. LAM2021]|uniref:MBOAT family O-acyltransferase n=1 Tax=Kosakonia sp. LAM2021 TaxID=2800475 RepID=UPI00190DE2EC|nr:MBOAT family protein [Kosakonia sp. LAM2021]